MMMSVQYVGKGYLLLTQPFKWPEQVHANLKIDFLNIRFFGGGELDRQRNFFQGYCHLILDSF